MKILLAFQFLLSACPQGRVAFLPWAPIILKSLKPKEPDLEPQTVGHHIRKKRLALGLTQYEAGRRLGVTPFTVINWENGIRKPAVQHVPAICWFLGYDSEPPTRKTLPERLAAKRRELGWSQRAAAKALGVDPCTWSDWERGGTIMAIAHRRMIARFLGLSEVEVYFTMRQRWNDSHGRVTCI